ncbi:MAG: ribonuclease P protein component [bacterium]
MLSRTYRIAKHHFPAVSRGKVVQNEYMRIVIKQDPQLNNSKFAVIVSNKIAKKAVVRNLIRRQVYSILEKNRDYSPNSFISLFPKKADVSFEVLQKSVQDLLCLKK